ncbi:MAG: TrkA C-terminal domain-containing protein [Streptosporangiaceae bacterium]
MAAVRRPDRRRRDAAVQETAHRRRSAKRRRRPAGHVRQRVPGPGPAPGRGLRPRRAAGAVRRRHAGARLDHQRQRAARRGPRDRRSPAPRRPARARPGAARPDSESSSAQPPTPLPGYQVLEVAIEEGSPASGKALGTITWPPGCFPVSVLRNRRLREPGPAITLAPGDRINLLARAAQHPAPRQPRDKRPDGHAQDGLPASQPPHSGTSELPWPGAYCGATTWLGERPSSWLSHGHRAADAG